MPFGFIWFHLASLGFSSCYLISHAFTCLRLACLNSIWFQLITLGLTRLHTVSTDFTWLHMVSRCLICFLHGCIRLFLVHLTSPELQGKGSHTREKGNHCGAKGKRESRHRTFFDLHPPYIHTARTHARTNETKRNDFPVGLTP